MGLGISFVFVFICPFLIVFDKKKYHFNVNGFDIVRIIIMIII